jgi:hypothetical protein
VRFRRDDTDDVIDVMLSSVEGRKLPLYGCPQERSKSETRNVDSVSMGLVSCGLLRAALLALRTCCASVRSKCGTVHSPTGTQQILHDLPIKRITIVQ